MKSSISLQASLSNLSTRQRRLTSLVALRGAPLHTIVFCVWASCIGFLSPKAQAQWSAIAPMPASRHSFAAATGPDGLVYVVGGLRGLRCLGSVDRYAPLTNAWSAAKDLLTPRCDAGVVFAPDGFIYAIGGSVGNISTNLVERYNFSTKLWENQPSLNVKRSHPGVAVGPDLRIYAMGGFDEPSSTGIDSIEVYDTASGNWTLLAAKTSSPGSLNAVTGPDGNIYAFGVGPGATWSKFDGGTWSVQGVVDPASNGDFIAATGPDGLMYLLGVGVGSVLNGSSGAVAYDANGTAAELPSLIRSRGSAGAAAVAEGRVFIAGGYSKSLGEMSAAEAYGPLNAPLGPNVRAWWRFDESSVLILDSAGSNAGANIGGAIHGPGRVNKALLFNGTNQYVKISDSPSVNFGDGNLSIEGWIMWTPNGNAVTTILDKRTTSRGQFKGYLLFIYVGGRLGFQLGNGTTYQNYFATNTKIQPNQWTHVAVTVDRVPSGPTNAVALYVNSVRDKSFIPVQGSISTPALLTIGRHSFDKAFFKGSIDELTMYNRVLRWDEIRGIFLAGRAGKQ